MTVDWSEIPSALTERKVDMVASGMVTSPELTAKFGASDVYLAADLAICTLSGAPLADEAALAGKTVGVQSGSTAESLVGAIQGLGERRVYSQLLGALVDLQAGKLDAVVAERPVCQWILTNHPEYAGVIKISGTIETGEGYAFWFNSDDQELLAAVNAALQELAPGCSRGPADDHVRGGTTTTTLAETAATVGATTSTTEGAPAAKSVLQLLFEKWGLTGTLTE